MVSGIELVHSLGDSSSLGSLVESLDWDNLGDRGLDELWDLGGVSPGGSLGGLLGGSLLLWEDDELLLVLSESLDVLLEGGSRSVSSSVVDGDADGLGEGWADSGLLEFLEGESLSGSWLSGVSGGAGSDDGSELVKRSWEGGGGLGSSGLESGQFAAWLVEEGLHPLLPVLSEMNVGEDIVVLNHLVSIDFIFYDGFQLYIIGFRI